MTKTYRWMLRFDQWREHRSSLVVSGARRARARAKCIFYRGSAECAPECCSSTLRRPYGTAGKTGPNFVQTGGTDARVVGLIKDGAVADIVIVQTSEMAGLEKAGLVKAGTVKPLGRVDIAVGVKAGAPHPDISTYPKFRDVLLAAGAVAYTDPKSGSAGGMLIESFLNKPEFANLKRVHNARVATGEVPIWLETVGQMRGAYGVDAIGKVPESLNAHLQFSIAVGANAKYPEVAAEFEKLRPAAEVRADLDHMGCRSMRNHIVAGLALVGICAPLDLRDSECAGDVHDAER